MSNIFFSPLKNKNSHWHLPMAESGKGNKTATGECTVAVNHKISCKLTMSRRTTTRNKTNCTLDAERFHNLLCVVHCHVSCASFLCRFVCRECNTQADF